MNLQEIMEGKWTEFTATDERQEGHSWLYGTITLNGKLYNCVLQGKHKYQSYYKTKKYNCSIRSSWLCRYEWESLFYIKMGTRIFE